MMQAAPSSDTAAIDIITITVSPVQAKTGPAATIWTPKNAHEAVSLASLFTILTALTWFLVTLSKEHHCDSAGSEPPDTLALRLLPQLCYNHALMLQALTSSELRSRLSKQGKRFQQQLTERGALNQLMTAVQSGDSDAKLQLFGITKVCHNQSIDHSINISCL